MREQFIDNLIEELRKRTEKRDPREVRKALINKIIELYFAIDAENVSNDLRYDFLKWLTNGDHEEEKDDAMIRCFERYCQEPTGDEYPVDVLAPKQDLPN